MRAVVFEGNSQIQAPGGLYAEGLLRFEYGGLIYLKGLIFGFLRYLKLNHRCLLCGHGFFTNKNHSSANLELRANDKKTSTNRIT